ncbi:MAG: DUF58 domain-containing protein [Dethiobacter sp.]|jgi:uncharacterized protein (DUF58 family)|nr:DUF58 domain-containing protein [Dethiobacter sp.]
MVRIKKPLILAVCFFGSAALLAGGKLPYMFFYLTVLAFTIPFLMLRKSLSRLTGDIQLSSLYGEVGQSLKVRYRVINSETGSFPYLELGGVIGSPTLQFREEREVINIGPGEVVQFEREVLCARRGKYDINSLTVKSGDPFGFFQLEKSLAAGKEIKVYPRLKDYSPINLPPVQHIGDSVVKGSIFENYSQVSDLREWQDGDNIKKIHWKQSARQNDIIVKNFERRGDGSLTIFVDMTENNYIKDRRRLLEDLALEVLTSLVYFNLRENLPLCVFCDSAQGSPFCGKNLGDYRSIMDRLISLAPEGQVPFASYVHNQSYYLNAKSSLYLITPSLTQADAAVLLGLKQKGFSQVLFYPALGELEQFDELTLKKVKEAGIRVHLLQASERGKEL